MVRAGTFLNASANRWARLLVGLVKSLLVVSVAVATASSEANITFGIAIPHPATTTAATSTYVYDAPASVPLVAREIDAAEASPAQLSELREGSASPAVKAQGIWVGWWCGGGSSVWWGCVVCGW